MGYWKSALVPFLTVYRPFRGRRRHSTIIGRRERVRSKFFFPSRRNKKNNETTRTDFIIDIVTRATTLFAEGTRSLVERWLCALCAVPAVSCPTGAVCLCIRAYISKPVVTAPPLHYLSHASAPIFIGEVIHEASSSSPLLPPSPPPLPSVGTQPARFHGD